jgi:dCTP deaminase
MILSDREIQIALASGQLKITPVPPPEAYSSTSVDLTLAKEAVVWKETPGVNIQPGVPGFKYTRLVHLQDKITVSGYQFKSKTLILAYTDEYIDIPITSRLAARVEGKSSRARLGVGIHITAPTVHAGFKGQLQLEMYNFGPHNITLDAGMKICQLIFERTAGTPQAGYAGMFAGQTSSPK